MYITVDIDVEDKFCTIWTSDHKVFGLNGYTYKEWAKQIYNLTTITYKGSICGFNKTIQDVDIYVDTFGSGMILFNILTNEYNLKCNKVKGGADYRKIAEQGRVKDILEMTKVQEK